MEVQDNIIIIIIRGNDPLNGGEFYHRIQYLDSSWFLNTNFFTDV